MFAHPGPAVTKLALEIVLKQEFVRARDGDDRNHQHEESQTRLHRKWLHDNRPAMRRWQAACHSHSEHRSETVSQVASPDPPGRGLPVSGSAGAVGSKAWPPDSPRRTRLLVIYSVLSVAAVVALIYLVLASFILSHRESPDYRFGLLNLVVPLLDLFARIVLHQLAYLK